ncbi:drug/metabolite transporter (DMT)-like permease [Bacillus mesophilus]|uniref:DMT family transporter n=1 Tax=Bacillus mesophilus TaxID=1808955 RepID=A0A6M0QE87_9BACI|nr:drug/metabolite transporter (DMT)-like permease [Bacillus mesophilus]NEY73578.1 DMT family transporter [Bacillus mesophilus]
MSKWLLYQLLFWLMVIWGFNVSAVKILVTYFPPAFMQGTRILIAGLSVLLILLFMKSLRKVTRKNIIGLLIAAFVGVVGHHLCLAIGLMSTTATNAGLILGLIPLCTAILAMIFLNERLTITKSLGIFMALIGVYLIVMNENGRLNDLSIGDLFVLGGVITQAISFILIKKLAANIESRQMTGMMLVFGSLMLLIISFFTESPETITTTEIPSYVWWILIASAVIATGLGHMVYNYAIHQLGASTTAIFINLSPFFSVVGSVLFLGEQIHAKHIVGFTFIISGVILGTGAIKLRYLNKGRMPQVKKAIGK